MAAERQAAIERWYCEGGEYFLQWTRSHYCRWSGEPLRWDDPFLEDLYLLFGTPWLELIVVEKAGQMGFTELLAALTAFALAALRIPTAFGFESQRKLNKVVGARIQPAFDFCDPIQKLRQQRHQATGRKDTNAKVSQIGVGGVTGTFFHAGTLASAKKSGAAERQVSDEASSFEAWLVNIDELEACPPDILDIARERQSACQMASKPLRAGSTPGGESGPVASQLRGSGYLFEWTIRCPHCSHIQSLYPLGNLLKPARVEDEDTGAVEERYLDATGRPLEWFCHDASSDEARIATAYIGCRQCSGEIDWDTIARGQFHCSRTGKTARQLCAETLKAQQPLRDGVALRMPRLATVLFSAPERIRNLVKSRNPLDALQQGLGIAISIGGGKISLNKLLRAVGLPLPPEVSNWQTLIVLGVDQGGAHGWGLISRWHLPPAGAPDERWLSARKEILWYGEVVGSGAISDLSERFAGGIDALVERWGVDLVGMDADPEIQIATNYARKHRPDPTSKAKGQVYLFDQVILKGEDFRRSERRVQGEQVPVFALHRSFGLDAVRNRLYRGLQHFPADLFCTEGDPGNLLYHYRTSKRLDDGQWDQPYDPDHWFHADNFAEVAVLAHLNEPEPKRLVFGGIKRD